MKRVSETSGVGAELRVIYIFIKRPLSLLHTGLALVGLGSSSFQRKITDSYFEDFDMDVPVVLCESLNILIQNSNTLVYLKLSPAPRTKCQKEMQLACSKYKSTLAQKNHKNA